MGQPVGRAGQRDIQRWFSLGSLTMIALTENVFAEGVRRAGTECSGRGI